MKSAPARQRRALQRVALRYYRRHGRDLPWRRSPNPYRILVSEFMLQQTQVKRVIPKYFAFLSEFPTLASLARATLAEVLRLWVGLGYNQRALRLWRCARIAIARHGGLPRDEPSLRRLPGVGAYTAAALASFAFGQQAAAVDVNVRRVLSRALRGRDSLPHRMLQPIAYAVLPSGRAAEWTQALMDIGASFCRARPQCGHCPLSRQCIYRRRDASFPKALRRSYARKAPAARERFEGSSRFYRGRIIQVLSAVPSRSVLRLGMQVKPGFEVSERPWLWAMLHALQREGLVRLSRGGTRVSLA